MCIARGELAWLSVRSGATFALARISMCATSEFRSESRTTYKKQRFAQILVSIAYSLNDMGMRRQAGFVLCVQDM